MSIGTSSRFVLRGYARKLVEIGEPEYLAVGCAKTGLAEIIGVESKLDYVMENYVELEEEILKSGLRALAFSSPSHIELQVLRELIGRRLHNFLSASRLYTDALRQWHAPAVLNPTDLSDLRHMLDDGPHQPMEHRIIRSLRNFSQHQGLALSGMTIDQAWNVSRDENDILKKETAYHAVIPKFDAVYLAERGRVPADVGAELRTLGRSVGVMGFVRKHVEYLGSVNDTFRRLSSTQAKEWESVLRRTKQRFIDAQTADKKDPLVVRVVALSESGDENSCIEIFEDFFNYWKYLARKNLSQVNFSRRYVRWTENND